MSEKQILFIRGIADNQKVSVEKIDVNGKLIFTLPSNCGLYGKSHSESLQSSQITFDTLLTQHIEVPKDVDVIVNQIADPLTHTASLHKLEQVYNAYKEQVRFLNPPQSIRKTSRERLSLLLSDIPSVTTVRTISFSPLSAEEVASKIEEEKLKLPLLLRTADRGRFQYKHLLSKKDEALFMLPLDGRTYMLSEFIETKQDDLYCIYHIAVIDGEVVLDDVLVQDSWYVKKGNAVAFAQKHPESEAVRKKHVAHFEAVFKLSVDKAVKEIVRVLGLDFFTIVCHVDLEGHMTIFSIEACISLDKPSIKEAFTALLNR
jgi:hypothetical protein